MKKIRYELIVMLISLLSIANARDAKSQVISIDSVRSIAANFTANQVGTDTLTIEAVVTFAKGRFAYLQQGNSAIVAFQNSTGGVGLRDSITSGHIRKGALMRVRGLIKNFNSLLEFDPVTSFQVLSYNNPLPAAQVVSLADLATNAERYESALIKIRNVKFAVTGSFANATNYNVTDPSTTSTFVFRTQAAADAATITGSPIPTNTVFFEGVLGQFSSGATNTGYQLAGWEPSNVLKGFALSVLHNNDGESRLINSGTPNYGGVAYFKTLSDSFKLRANRTGTDYVLLSSGDNFLAGTSFAASTFTGISYDGIALDSLNYDAICLGNHDFDFGPDTLAKIINTVGGGVPYLGANLNFSAEPSLQALVNSNRIRKSVIIDRRGEKIGVIGAVTETLPFISSPRNVVVNAVLPAVQAEITALKNEGVNKIILISHLQGFAADSLLIRSLQDVDLAIAGGGSEVLSSPSALLVPGDTRIGPYPVYINDATNKPIPVVTTGGDYKYVGRFIVEFDSVGNITQVGSESDPIRVSQIPPDGVQPEPGLLLNVVTPVQNFINTLSQTIVGTTEVPLDGRNPTPIRTRETNAGNLLADALLWQARVLVSGAPNLPTPTFSIQNGGGYRLNSIVPVGNITAQTTFDIAPFSNFVSITKVPRSQAKEILEHGYSSLPAANGKFIHLGGLRVILALDTNLYKQRIQSDATGLPLTINGVVRSGERVREAVILKADGSDSIAIVQNGQVVPGDSVVIASNDFSIKGGDGYPFRNSAFTTLGATYQIALQSYIATGLSGTISASGYPESGRGRIVQTNVVLSSIQTPASGVSTTSFGTTNFIFNASVTTPAPISVSFVNGVQPTPSPLPGGITVVSNYYWQVSSNAVFTNGKVRFPLSALSGVQNPTALRVLRRSNSSAAWQDLGGSIVNDTLESVTTFNAFSQFAIGSDASNSLPVELISFNARAVFEGVALDWKTATELNNDRFEIQRSSDRVTFETIGSVRGAGTTTEAQSYAFVDRDAQNGTFYYKLKQVDFDGTVDYSNVIEVIKDKPTAFELAQNYPNPFNPSTTINYQLAANSLVTLKVYDVVGREVASLINNRQEAGRYTVNFNAVNLASGIYFYRLEARATGASQSASYVSTKKMMFVK